MSETTNEYTEDEDSYMLEEDEEGDKGQTWSDVEKDSEDIRNDIERVLMYEREDFIDAFSFSESYADAPNPVLKLSDLGVVGLPLSLRDAEAIKSHAVQAPFGMGEETVVDKTVRDTWEMDAALITFGNPQWEEFVQKVVAEVCKTLGVDIESSRPQCELYKLLLYEMGSHFLPHVDTEKADGMFATIVIVLPSEFTGGAAHLSHSGLSVVYDCSTRSLLDTTALAWYTDVTHEIKPVTSGHRLALSYNLMHTAKSVRPALSTNDKVITRLANLLQRWQEDTGDNSPEKLVYILEHKYSQANLHAGALKGSDAQKTTVLEMLAKQHDFDMGLATADCRLVGFADEFEQWGARWGDRCFGVINNVQIGIEHFVDLEGKMLSPELEYKNAEIIPADPAGPLDNSGCDAQNYGGYMGNNAGPLEKWYRRAVLVIWPKRNRPSVLYSGNAGFIRACTELEGSTPAGPSAKDNELVELLLSKQDADPQRVAQVICQAACAWQDVDLWHKAISVPSKLHGLATISDDNKLYAVKAFGFEYVRSSIEMMLRADESNISRLEFLIVVQQWADTEPVIQTWLNAQALEVLKTLRAPAAAESNALLDAAKRYGGVSCLRDVMLPQLLLVADCSFLLDFASLVAEDQEFDETTRLEIVHLILVSAIEHTSFLQPISSPSTPDFSGRQLTEGYDCILAQRYIQKCIDLSCSDLAPAVITRLLDETAELSPRVARARSRDVLMPLVVFCAEVWQPGPDDERPIQFVELQKTAVALHLDWLRTNTAYWDMRTELARLLSVAVIDGNPGLFISTIVPALEAMNLTCQNLRDIVDEFRSGLGGQLVFPEGYEGRKLDAIVYNFAARYVDAVPLNDVRLIVDTLDWATTVHQNFTRILLQRLLDPEPLASDFVNDTLVSLVPRLCEWGTKRRVLDSLADTLQTIMVAWMDRTLGRAPSSNATVISQLNRMPSAWNCSCQHCTPAKVFLTEKLGMSKQFDRIGVSGRKHLEAQLTSHAQGLATYEVIQTMPQGLMVHRTRALHAYGVWKAKQDQGVTLLYDISPDAGHLRRLLGTHYNRIVTALGGSGDELPRPPHMPVIPAGVNRREPPPRAAGPVRSKHGAHRKPSASSSMSHNTATNQDPKPTASASEPALAGTKRKLPPPQAADDPFSF